MLLWASKIKNAHKIYVTHEKLYMNVFLNDLFLYNIIISDKSIIFNLQSTHIVTSNMVFDSETKYSGYYYNKINTINQICF